MDHRNDNATPLERINDDFIRKMLADDGNEYGTGASCNENDYQNTRVLNNSNNYYGTSSGSACDCGCSGGETQNIGTTRQGSQVYGSVNLTRNTQGVGYARNSCSCGNGCSRGRSAGGYSARNNNYASYRNAGVDNTSNCTNGVGIRDGFTVPTLEGAPLSMVYSPYQEWEDVYEPCEGLERGTVFADLDFPFYPTPCKNDGCRKSRN